MKTDIVISSNNNEIRILRCLEFPLESVDVIIEFRITAPLALVK